MKNIHITLTPFANESRVIKELSTLEKLNALQSLIVICVLKDNLAEVEKFGNKTTVKRFNNTFSNKAYAYYQFAKFAIKHGKLEKGDVVNVHSILLLPLACYLKFRFGVKIVYDMHELETHQNHFSDKKIKVFSVLERLLYRYVDLTICVGKNIQQFYTQKYPDNPPILLFNVPYLSDKPAVNLKQILGISHETTLYLYQGYLTANRGIEDLLDAFDDKEVRDKNYHLLILGYGDLAPLIASKTTENIHLLDAVHPTVLLEYTKGADVGFSLIHGSSLSYKYCAPNKLFEYIHSDIKIIATNLVEQSEILKDYDGYITVEPTDQSQLKRAIIDINQPNYAPNNDLKHQYCWDAQEDVLLQAYTDLLKH
ncbi:MAG: glycosyltransferase [Glaciecola sp.]